MTKPPSAWPAALIFLVAVLVTEALPLLGGTGASPRYNWSLAYATLHFVLLPLAAGLHIVWNVGALVFAPEEERRGRWIASSSVVIPLAYVVLLLLRPALPLFSD